MRTNVNTFIRTNANVSNQDLNILLNVGNSVRYFIDTCLYNEKVHTDLIYNYINLSEKRAKDMYNILDMPIKKVETLILAHNNPQINVNIYNEIFKKNVKIYKESEECVFKILLKKGFLDFYKKLNKPYGYDIALIFVIINIGFIDALSVDHQGSLNFLEYVAQDVCKINNESFNQIQTELLKAIDFRISCK